MCKSRLCVYTIVILFASATNINADVIYLKNGQRIYGKISEYKVNTLTIATQEGDRKINKINIRKVKYRDEEKARELEARRIQIRIQRKKLIEQKKTAQKQQENNKLNEILAAAKKLEEQIARLEAERIRLEQTRQAELQEVFKGKPPEFKPEELTVKTGMFNWKSSAIENGFGLENSKLTNLALAGRPEITIPSGASAQDVGLFENISIGYGTGDREEGFREQYTFSIMQSRFNDIAWAGASSSSVDFTSFNGTTVDITEQNTELFTQPTVTKAEFEYRYEKFILKKLDNKYLQPLTLQYGFSLTADQMEAKGNFGIRNRNAVTTPSDPLFEGFMEYGTGPQTSDLEYGRVILGINLGLGYRKEIGKRHVLDARYSLYTGKGAGNYLHTNWAMMNLPGFQIPQIPVEMETNGDTRIDYSGKEYEIGYSYKLDTLTLRISYFERSRRASITESTVERGWDWYYNLAGLLNGDVAPLYLSTMDPMGPFPSANEFIHGLVFEVIYPF